MKFRVGFGKKAGVWSLYQEQSNGMGAFGTVDASDNIDLWMAVGDRAEASTLDAREAVGTPARTAYAQSTGLAHIIAKPNLGVLGISLIGSGVGPGCGSQVIVNDSALYFKGNINN